MEISKPYFLFSSLSFRALKFLWEGMSFLGLIYMILHALFVTKNNFSLILKGAVLQMLEKQMGSDSFRKVWSWCYRFFRKSLC